MVNDLASVHPGVERDTQWLALCLSGSSAPPPGGVVDLVSDANVRVVDVHTDTPWKRIIKEYLIQKVDALPGHAASSKGKRTKMSYFIEAVDNVPTLSINSSSSGRVCFALWKSLEALRSSATGLCGLVHSTFCSIKRNGTGQPLNRIADFS